MVDDEDAARWMAAAEEDSLLVAAELYFLSRPSERVPWRMLLERRRSPPRWGRRRPRSRGAPAKEAPASWSPTTPLSWSGGCPSSSGEKAKRRRGEPGADAPAVGSVVPKVETQDGDERADGKSPPQVAAKRRQTRKKMTLAELRDSERSLLEERDKLRRDVEGQRMHHKMLLEENARLRGLELNLQLKAVPRPKKACTTVVETKTKNAGFLQLDLNLALPDELDAAW